MAFNQAGNLPNFALQSEGKNNGQLLQYLKNGFGQKIEVDAGSGVDITYDTNDLLDGLVLRTPDLEFGYSNDITESADVMLEKIKLKMRSLAGPNFAIHAGFYFDFAIYCDTFFAAIYITGGNGVSFGVIEDFGSVSPLGVSWFRLTILATVDDGAPSNEIYISQLSNVSSFFNPPLLAPGLSAEEVKKWETSKLKVDAKIKAKVAKKVAALKAQRKH